MIKIKNVVKYYPDFTLGPISLEFRNGEFVSVVGPSGSGKSTLIRILTNHNKIDSGEVSYVDCNELDIMYISQMGTTFNHLTVKDNLNLKVDYADEVIISALDQVGLASVYMDKYPFELSGGERQRIDLVRAILSNSKYIVLDESMSALDSYNKRAISSLLKEFTRNQDICIIYITHDVDQAIEFSSKIVELELGKVKFSGLTQEFMSRKRGE